MTKFTTEQILRALANAKGHNHRVVILKCATEAQLKKIAVSEEFRYRPRGHWDIEELADKILNTIESRYEVIDQGRDIYVPGLFGMPYEINTYLTYTRKQHVQNGTVSETDDVPFDEFSKALADEKTKKSNIEKKIEKIEFVNSQEVFDLALRLRSVTVVDSKNRLTPESQEKVDAIQKEYQDRHMSSFFWLARRLEDAQENSERENREQIFLRENSALLKEYVKYILDGEIPSNKQECVAVLLKFCEGFDDYIHSENAEIHGVVDELHDDDLEDCNHEDNSSNLQEITPASQTRKHTKKSKQEIIPFQLGMFYIVNVDEEKFNARVTAFIEHFSKSSKTDKNGKIKNKIVRSKSVCFDVLRNGEIKHLEAFIGIDEDSCCEYAQATVYPPYIMYANNPVEGATPYTVSDITPEYKFKLEERYPVTLRDYYGNIKCVSFCNASQVTFEYDAHNTESYSEQKLLTVPVFVDPETKSQFVLIGSRTCYAHDSKQENNIQEVKPVESDGVKPETQNESLQATASETQEAWFKVAHELGYSWKRAQFIRGCIILKEYDAYKKELEQKNKRYATLSASRWLYEIYSPSLKSIRELAAFFGVDVPEDKYHKNTIERRIFISRILATLIFCDMNCVFVRTYIVQNPPALPPELTEHGSKHALKRTRTPRKRKIITSQDILSCDNENDALSLLLTCKKEDLIKIANDLHISIGIYCKISGRITGKKHNIAHHIAHDVFLRKRIESKKLSPDYIPPAEGRKVEKIKNFYYTLDADTGQIGFIFN